MNIVPRPNAAIAMPEADDPWAEIAQEGGGQFGKILKFVKGTWSHGDDIVPIGTEFIAHITEAMRGYVRFDAGRPAEHRIGLIRDRFKFPNRESLGFIDQFAWDRDNKGNPRDPWAKQTYLPLVHVENGEFYCFVFSSSGATGAFRDLCKAYSPHRNSGKLPIISLQAGRYNHPDYSWIDVPVLKIEGWDEGNLAPPIAPASGDTGAAEIIPPTARELDALQSMARTERAKAAVDMNDDIPF